MKTEQLIKKLKDETKPGKTFKIFANYNNDKYQIDLCSCVLDSDSFNAVATIYANDKYMMTKSFKQILPVLEKFEIRNVF